MKISCIFRLQDIYLFYFVVFIYTDPTLTLEQTLTAQLRLQPSSLNAIKYSQNLTQQIPSTPPYKTRRSSMSSDFTQRIYRSGDSLSTTKAISVRISSSVAPGCNSQQIYNDGRCELFTGSFCMDVFIQQNRTFAWRNCSTIFTTIDNKLKKIYHLLDATSEANEKCLKAVKWLACSTIFPSCTKNNEIKTLPCAESCNVIKNTICSNQWNDFLTLQETLLDKIAISNCKAFPNKSRNMCLYPQFIKDMVNQRSKQSMEIIIGISIGVVFTFVFLFITMLLCCRKKNKKVLQQRQVSMKEIKEVHQNIEARSTNVEIIGDTSPEYDSIEKLVAALGLTVFTKEHLTFDENLGEGAFGKVVRCKTRNMGHSFNIDLVAVKYLKQNPSKEMERTFDREVEILSNFDHPNVIPLVGVCLEGPMCLVLEFMKYGDLNHYIRIRSGSYHAVAGSYGNLPDGVDFSPPELSFHNLLLITSQIADGVSYLAAKRFVHRDIATRNILVGEDLQVKISDFGLAHDIYGSDYYRVDTQKMLPLRWLSPEALSLGKFTVSSDIWSFGVTMWEIFTYGMQPFYGCNNEEVCYRIRCHKNLERPYCCPQKIYDLMKACWKFEPSHRKDTSYVKNTITKWLEDKESFIQESWQRLLLPPLPDRRPTIKKAKLKYLNIRSEITL